MEEEDLFPTASSNARSTVSVGNCIKAESSWSWTAERQSECVEPEAEAEINRDGCGGNSQGLGRSGGCEDGGWGRCGRRGEKREG